MITFENIQQLALSFPEAHAAPHFDKYSFRVRNKIFATYDSASKLLCLKLSEVDQDVFTKVGKEAIYAVQNKWGKQGWTLFEIEKLHTDLVVDALTTAYCEVAPAKLSKMVRPDV